MTGFAVFLGLLLSDFFEGFATALTGFG